MVKAGEYGRRRGRTERQVPDGDMVTRGIGKARWRPGKDGMTNPLQISTGPTHLRMLILVAVAVTALMLVAGSVVAAGAAWKVGRASVTGAPGSETLKISLRNTGAPSDEEVRILGRWTPRAPGPSTITQSDLGSLGELGTYSRDVRMKQTAIIEIPLDTLGPREAGGKNLEVAVVTGGRITDGIIIGIEF